MYTLSDEKISDIKLKFIKILLGLKWQKIQMNVEETCYIKNTIPKIHKCYVVYIVVDSSAREGTNLLGTNRRYW